RRRHTRSKRDWSSDVCSSDLRETRLVQEMMLGLGGVRLLQTLGVDASVFHLNEGHSAFLTLELARQVIEKDRVTFSEAMKRVRRSEERRVGKECNAGWLMQL